MKAQTAAPPAASRPAAQPSRAADTQTQGAGDGSGATQALGGQRISIEDSPLMVAQRQRTATLLGGPIQRRQAASLGQISPAPSPTIQLGRRREAGYLDRGGKPKSEKLIRMEEFGSLSRKLKLDPDKIEQPFEGEDIPEMEIAGEDINKQVGIWRPSKEDGSARPEDPPIYQPFRKAFHEAHDIKLSIERKLTLVPGGFSAFDEQHRFKDRLLATAVDVKKASVDYKTSVRTFSHDTTVRDLKAVYFARMKELTIQVQEMSTDMITTSLQAIKADTDYPKAIRAHSVRQGKDIWRNRWEAAVQAINAILERLWGRHKPSIMKWVDDKRKDEGLTYMDPERVGNLDYIGSLAKGYKSAPKQYLRFMPEQFDVDASLDAAPLAVYAIDHGQQVDRGNLRSKEITPLEAFEREVNLQLFEFKQEQKQEQENEQKQEQEHEHEHELEQHPPELGKPSQARIAGLDTDEKFAVFIRASHVESLMQDPYDKSFTVDRAKAAVSFSNHLQNIQDRIWWLRSRDLALWKEIGKWLLARDYLTADGGSLLAHAHKLRDPSTEHTYTVRDLDNIEGMLGELEMRAEEAEKPQQVSEASTSSPPVGQDKRAKKTKKVTKAKRRKTLSAEQTDPSSDGTKGKEKENVRNRKKKRKPSPAETEPATMEVVEDQQAPGELESTAPEWHQ